MAIVFQLSTIYFASREPSTQFDFEFEGRRYSLGVSYWKTTDRWHDAASQGRSTRCIAGNSVALRTISSTTIPSSRFTTSGRHRDQLVSSTDKLYVVQTSAKVVRALHSHDHRSRRPRPRSHLRLRHHRLRRRTMGPPLDHHRHLRVALALARARIMGARYPYYLLADSKDGQHERSRSHAAGSFRGSDPRQHPPGLRL